MRSPSRERRYLADEACALAVRPRLRLDMQNSSHSGRRNIAPPPPKPRGGPRGAGGGEEQAG